MNLLPSEIKAYVKKLLPNLPPTRDCEVIICPSFISLGQAISALRGTGVAVAAQNVSEFSSGAYTGEVSAPQLSDIGATHVIVGHSERRIYFGEKDLTVNRKVLTVLEHGMRPIVCIGAVSYTHLDVYKRQVLSRGRKAGIGVGALASVRGVPGLSFPVQCVFRGIFVQSLPPDVSVLGQNYVCKY